MRKFSNGLMIFHDILKWASFLFVASAFVMLTYEKSLSFEHFIKYFVVIPKASHFADESDITYYSFAVSYKEADIKWNETLFCSENGITFTHVDTAETGELNFFNKREYSPQILRLMEEVYQSGNRPTDEQQVVLREYADDAVWFGDWRLNVHSPASGSLCYAEHTITVKTPFFGVEKRLKLISSPFTYGIKPEDA